MWSAGRGGSGRRSAGRGGSAWRRSAGRQLGLHPLALSREGFTRGKGVASRLSWGRMRGEQRREALRRPSRVGNDGVRPQVPRRRGVPSARRVRSRTDRPREPHKSVGFHRRVGPEAERIARGSRGRSWFHRRSGPKPNRIACGFLIGAGFHRRVGPEAEWIAGGPRRRGVPSARRARSRMGSPSGAAGASRFHRLCGPEAERIARGSRGGDYRPVKARGGGNDATVPGAHTRASLSGGLSRVGDASLMAETFT